MAIEKKNKIIFERINATPGYYHVKDWENDYKRQLATQRFVRHVFYRPRRQPKTADPKEGIIPSDDDQNQTGTSSFPTIKSAEDRRSTYPKKSSNSQIGRIRNIREKPRVSFGNSPNRSHKQYKDMYNIIEDGVGADAAEMLQSGDEDDEENDIEADKNRRELATVERLISITYDNTQNESIESEGEVSCWLVNEELLLIIATANTVTASATNPSSDQEREATVPSYIQAEADILISDLGSIKGHTIEALLEDEMKLLQGLAKEIVDTVTIQIDAENDARLLLSLVPPVISKEVSPHPRKESITTPKPPNQEEKPNKRPDSKLEEKYANLGVSQEDLAKMITGN
jgi:hypothetical protein